VVPRGVNGRNEAAEWWEGPVSDGVDAAMEDVKPAGCDPPRDRPRVQAERDKLRVGDDAIVGARKRSDPRVDRTLKKFATYSVVKFFFVGHAPSFRVAALRRCDEGDGSE
jgi:hypothetical protein